MTDQRGGAAPPHPSDPSSSASGGLGLDTHGTSPAPPPDNKPELPWAFIDCSTDVLVVLIAHMLDLLCQHNDQVVLTPDALTRFHSRAPPNITVIDYLRRIVKYTNLEKIPLLSLLAYIDLTCQNLPTFTLSSLTVHRFLIAGVTAGSKAQCDVFCTNSHYAKVGGIKVNELNSLEREFLRVTGWALCCNADLLQRYYTSLIRSQGGYQQASEPEVSPFRAFPDAGKPVPAPEDSAPATPVEAEHPEEEEDAMASGSEFDDDDEVEDTEMNGTAPPGPEAEVPEDRGRSRGNTMEVDSPTVRTTPHLQPPPSSKSRSPSKSGSKWRSTSKSPSRTPLRGNRSPARGLSSDSASTNASAPSNGTGGKTLKQFVGGIFRRHDTSGSTGEKGASPDKRLKSRPVGEPATAPVSHVGSAANSVGGSAGSGGGSIPPTPPIGADGAPVQPVTPRVRTRDERSVDSLRVPPLADDGKRRARVE